MAKCKKGVGLAGLTTLMNSQYVDQTIDLHGIEEKILRHGEDDSVADAVSDTGSKKEIAHLNAEINKLSKDLGIKLGGTGIDNVSTVSSRRPPLPPQRTVVSRLQGLDDSSNSSSSSSSSSSESEHSEAKKTIRKPPSVVSSHSTPKPRRQPSIRAASSHRGTSAIAAPPPRNDFLPKREAIRYDLDIKPHVPATMKSITEEQRKKEQIHAVIGNIRGETRNTFSTDMDRLKDMKASKLEQIACIRGSLQDQNIDVRDVPTPCIDTPIEEVDAILNLLLRKNNRYRYSSLAEEFICAGAEIIESVFDGSRPVPLIGIKPDYTGFSSSVQVKVHRIRFETSELVGSIVEKHNLSPFTRIMMELLPSLALYPRIRSKQKAVSTTSNPNNGLGLKDSMHAYNSIRNKMTKDPDDDEFRDMKDV